MDLDKFKEAFEKLNDYEKINLYRDYQREIGDEELWYDFDEEFFNVFFSNPMDAVRAWHFGSSDNSWNDEFIHFNGYGNLETAAIYQVADEASDLMEEIYDHPALWREYIDPDDFEDDEDDEDEEDEEDEEDDED